MPGNNGRKGLIRILAPPPGWRLIASIGAGLFIGLAITALQISNASSYLSDEPEACINCHIMTPHYATWQHSSHREKATCNDCHVPHDNIVRKYYFKANDGMRHAGIFTMGMERQVIRINEPGIEVVQDNCLRCHLNQVNPVSAANVSGRNFRHGEGMLCWGCHREVPHGRVLSEASTPNAIRPNLKPAFPEWMKSENNK